MDAISTIRSIDKLIAGRLLTIIVPLLLFFMQAEAQSRLKTPIKLKIEDGNYEDVSVVMKNNTTGESNTVAGVSKFDLDLKINCDYVISFSKPGYITKKIALNTTAPADRITQGFYPFNYEVVLFPQYDGVNIVIFNQPVGKISYNRLIDDFDYDTDYTKQIQSALKAADAEIKKKQKEANANAELQRKEEEKKKIADAAAAKEAEKANQEAKKKAAEEAKLLAAEAAKNKKAEEEAQKKAAAAMGEEERRTASAKMEEEERAKAKAAEDEEARKNSGSTQGNDAPPSGNPSGSGEDQRPGINAGTGEDKRGNGLASGSGEETPGGKAGMGSGIDEAAKLKAGANTGNDKGISKAVKGEGEDSRPEKAPEKKTAAPTIVSAQPVYEVLPDISVTETDEGSRIVTRVTVRKNDKETVFSKIKYTWGGIFYFRQNMSISESLYFMNTGRR